MTPPLLDPALTPARPDLAASHLLGMVAAERYVEGRLFQVSAAIAPIRRAPAPDAMQETQAQFGEVFTVYDERDGWGWGQARLDGYVGYVEMDALSAPILAPTHRVTALRTYVFSRPDLKSAPHFLLSLNAQVTVEGLEGRYAKIARSGWVASAHVAPIGMDYASDWVGAAERFLGAPYFWGGRESLGLDCSGLIQSAMLAAGRACPRDARMQEQQVGSTLPDEAVLQRGDLIFWPGHVGVMTNAGTLLHANAHFMATITEPLADAVARIGPIRTRRRP